MTDNLRPLILISNDDSINAPGLKSLIDSVSHLGDVVVVAPDHPNSGMSSAFTVDGPLRINAREDYGGARIFTVNGTPVDCVKMAFAAILSRKPDLMLSGINHGSNSGNSVIYSGTMGAVLEACMEGVPSVGVSLTHHSMKADFSLSASLVTDICAEVLRNGLPNGICLNVNIPSQIVPVGIKACRAARGHWAEGYSRYLDPHGRPFYWMKGRFVNTDIDATDTDEYWLSNGYVTVVPVQADMTSHGFIKDLGQRLDR